MTRRRYVDSPVELIGADAEVEFERYMKLGQTHTAPFLERLIRGSGYHALNVLDALALAYLHGVWHGHQVGEKMALRGRPMVIDMGKTLT